MVTQNAQPKQLPYKTRELRALLSVSPKTLSRLEKRGLIRPLKALRTKLYSHSEVERFLRETE